MTTVTADKAVVKDPLALHPTTQAYVEKLNDMATIDVKEGKVNPIQDAYERTLPADITLAQAKAVHQHDAHLMAAWMEVHGNLSREAAAKNKTLESTSSELPMAGKNRFNVEWNRSEERNAGLPVNGQPPEKKTVYGTMTAKLTVAGAATSSGELNKVAKRQKAAAAEMFGTHAK